MNKLKQYYIKFNFNQLSDTHIENNLQAASDNILAYMLYDKLYDLVQASGHWSPVLYIIDEKTDNPTIKSLLQAKRHEILKYFVNKLKAFTSEEYIQFIIPKDSGKQLQVRYKLCVSNNNFKTFEDTLDTYFTKTYIDEPSLEVGASNNYEHVKKYASVLIYIK